jgi:hypothetical protein
MAAESVRRLLALLTGSPPRLRSLLLIVATLAAGRLCAQNLAPGAGYPVRGSVVNSVTGAPVPRALVELNADLAALTDGNGQFAFDNVPGQMYVISVSKPGYLGAGHAEQAHFGGAGVMHGESLPARRVVVGPDMPNLSFSITPEGAISGQVTLSTGDTPDGIRVQVYQRRIENGRPVWDMAGMATTRSDGTFRLGGLTPGSYMLNTMASMDNPGELGNNQAAVWGFPPVYYPGVTDPGAAGILTVGPGQQAEADFTLTHQQFFPVTIAVRSADGGLPANFEILDAGGQQTGFPARYEPRDQVVHASVPNGRWIVDAHSYGRAMGWGRATFQVASTAATVAVSLQEVPRIPVVINRNFSAANSQSSGNGPGVNLTLVDADAFDARGGGYLVPSPGEPGSWQLNLTQPGTYWVQATAFPPGYIASITSGGVDLASNPLLIAPGSPVSPIDVTLRDDGGSIAGQITGATAAGSGATAAPGEHPLVWIYAIPLFPAATDLPQAFVREDGSFTMANLAPGPYRVVACDTPQEIDFHSAESVGAWAGQGQTVTVDAGGSASVSLAITHAGAVTP